MKAKSTNKLVSLALALFMLLMSIPFSMLATTARAAEASATDPNTHVFESNLLGAKSTYTADTTVEYTPDKYFTLYMSSKSKVDTSKKAWDDGYGDKSVEYFRFSLGAPLDTSSGSNSLGFKTSGPAKVKVWWVYNCTEDNSKTEVPDTTRQLVIVKQGGSEVTSTTEGHIKNKAYIDTLEVKEAGSYLLGNKDSTEKPGGVYIFKVEVTETPATVDHLFNASEFKDTDVQGKDITSADKFFTFKFDSGKGSVTADKQSFGGYDFTHYVSQDGKTNNFTADKRYIEFKTTDKGQVTIWWQVSGDGGRYISFYDVAAGTETKDGEDAAKGDLIKSVFKFDKAGTYRIGSTKEKNFIYQILVQEGEITEVVRADWKDVADPVIVGAEQTKDDDGKDKNEIKVTVNALVGVNGGDKLAVTMYDKDGKEVATKNSLAEKDTHELTFAPTASGNYTFKAVLSRDEEATKKTSEASSETKFTLLLGTPTIISATSKGKGTVEVVWSPVDEATGYEVYCGTEKVYTAKADETTYMVTGLEIGKKFSFTVKAVRGEEVGEASKAMETKTTEAAQMTWGTVFYGTSTDSDHNTVTGDVNGDEGKVTVSSVGGKGKFQEGSNDGLIFHYATIPSNLNFTIRAKMTVDSWTLSSGQEGAGIMALDCLPGTFGGKANSSDLFWSNCYRVGAQRFAYWYDEEKGVNSSGNGGKYQMNIGLGVQAKLGMTTDNIKDVYKSAAGIVEFVEAPLETLPVDKKKDAGTYATIGNCTNPETFKNPAVAELKEFVIELQRNNTGYFLTYYSADGKTILGQQKYYEPKALDQLDPDNVYVGFCAARNMTATFSDITITTIDPKDDKPAEERPITKVEPTVTIGSSSIANSPEYTLLVKSNVVGKADIIIGGKTVKTVDVKGTDEYASAVVTIAAGTNKIEVKFTPDKDQELPPYTQLSSTDPVTKTVNVKYETYFEKQNNLYVSPKGTKGGNGGKEYPLDIYTAVSVVRAGQTIVLMEGTYNLESSVTIERGMNGTKDKMIKMIADPEAKTRPVFDFGKKATVKTAGILAVGDYWYFQGFDVTKAPDGTPGIMVSGNNCTFDDIRTYTNGDCGLYIRSKGNSADPKSLWPTNNLILNCTSFDNADASGENADGFAAKFSIGTGNVFDGCVSYNNCDDGWDLYARGVSIEAVTLRNCVAYENGHNTDKSIKGNGNGFKLGGENMPAGHKIINSIAFNNDANGITCNSCPDLKIKNCISFDNNGQNVALYVNSSSLETSFEVDGLISFRSSGEDTPAAASADVVTTGAAGKEDRLEPNGGQKVEDLQGPNNFFFNGSASISKAEDGTEREIKADMFESLEFSGKVERAENGMVDLKGFLALKEDKVEAAFGKDFAEAMSNRFVSLDGDYKTGSNTAGTSQDITVTPDTELPPPTGFEVTIVVAVLAISAAVAIILIKKRKRNR